MPSLDERKKLLAKHQEQRNKHFEAVKFALDSDTSSETSARRARIPMLSLCELRGKFTRFSLRQFFALNLQDELQKEKITAVQALDAYVYKALNVQEKLNCICFFFKEAAAEAKALDVKYRGKQKPPLFGIPFSVKENFYVSLHCPQFFYRL